MKDSTSLQSFFDTTLLDNRGKNVSDINKGLLELFPSINDTNLEEAQYYLVSNFEEGYPELVAKNSAFSNTAYWWWLLLLNGLCDPLNDIKENWVYGTTTSNTVDSVVTEVNNEGSSEVENRVGQTVELN